MPGPWNVRDMQVSSRHKVRNALLASIAGLAMAFGTACTDDGGGVGGDGGGVIEDNGGGGVIEDNGGGG